MKAMQQLVSVATFFFLLLSSLYSFLISIALNKIISLGEASRDTEDDDGNVTWNDEGDTS